MASDDYMAGCPINDTYEDDAAVEEINTLPPPLEFASKAATPVLSAHPDAPCVVVSDVLVETTAPHSIEQVWVYSAVGFEKTRVWTYRFLSLLLAVPFAFLSGTFLAILVCLQVCDTFLPCLRSLCLCVVNDFIAPFCMSVALCCSHIAIFVSQRDCLQMRDKNNA
uniref:Caveolin n=1 Tax=Hippocampus comes TaxID=109280 RepID=A0A3Q2YT77_HIPCM